MIPRTVAAGLFAVTFIRPTAAQSDPFLARAALVAIRGAPLDSLTAPYCTGIALDPGIRLLKQPTLFGPAVPVTFVLDVPTESLKIALPVEYRAFDDATLSKSTAQVLIGVFRSDTTRQRATFIVEIGGCLLTGYLISIDVWVSGSQFRSRVRGIHEG